MLHHGDPYLLRAGERWDGFQLRLTHKLMGWRTLGVLHILDEFLLVFFDDCMDVIHDHGKKVETITNEYELKNDSGHMMLTLM